VNSEREDSKSKCAQTSASKKLDKKTKRKITPQIHQVSDGNKHMEKPTVKSF
jgi:hypothetical protein